MKPIFAGMKLCLSDGGTGSVADILVDVHSGEERYLVINVDGWFGPERLAPCAALWLVDEKAHLALTTAQAADLPMYTPQQFGAKAGLRRRPHLATGV